MRRRRPLAIAALLAAALAAPGALAAPAQAPSAAAGLRGDSWAATKQAHRGTITVPYYPVGGFAYVDSKGKLTGVVIELIEQFRSYLETFHAADVTIDYVRYDDFARFYDDVRHGQGGVIGLAGVTITEARKREVAFSPPYFSNVPVLVTNAKVPDLTGRDRIPTELAGFTALAFKGTTLETIVRRVQSEHRRAAPLETMGSYTGIVERLSRDPKAFGYLDLAVFWVARGDGAPLKRHRVGDEPREDFGFIMPLGSDWQAPLAEFFAAAGGYRQSRSYRSLLIKHLGVDLEELLDTGG